MGLDANLRRELVPRGQNYWPIKPCDPRCCRRRRKEGHLSLSQCTCHPSGRCSNTSRQSFVFLLPEGQCTSIPTCVQREGGRRIRHKPSWFLRDVLEEIVFSCSALPFINFQWWSSAEFLPVSHMRVCLLVNARLRYLDYCLLCL